MKNTQKPSPAEAEQEPSFPSIFLKYFRLRTHSTQNFLSLLSFSAKEKQLKIHCRKHVDPFCWHTHFIHFQSSLLRKSLGEAVRAEKMEGEQTADEAHKAVYATERRRKAVSLIIISPDAKRKTLKKCSFLCRFYAPLIMCPLFMFCCFMRDIFVFKTKLFPPCSNTNIFSGGHPK